jgi:hypothetical protein
MHTASTEEVFLASARSLERQIVRLDATTGLFPGGRNGPHFDIESPIRNTSHVLCAMGLAYSLTGDRRFRSSGQLLARFLLDEHEFLIGGVVVHRQRSQKDWSNGIVGPAWLIEGLTVGGRLLEIPEAISAASALSESQPFDVGGALWRRCDPRKGPGGIDRTLNHQAYFAAAAALSAPVDGGLHRSLGYAQAFLDHLNRGGLRVEPSGLLIHHVAGRNETQNVLRGLRDLALRRVRISSPLLRLRNGSVGSLHDIRERNVGYHIYSLFSLANLRRAVPDHPLWSSETLRQALSLVVTMDWLDSLDDNRYAYPYNAPGLELPLVARTFCDIQPQLTATADEAFARQVKRSLDTTSHLFVRATPDRLTLSARLYELGLSLAPERLLK